jgi:hypothetical protein
MAQEPRPLAIAETTTIATFGEAFIIMAECACGHSRELHTLFQRASWGQRDLWQGPSEVALSQVLGANAGNKGLSSAEVSRLPITGRTRCLKRGAGFLAMLGQRWRTSEDGTVRPGHKAMNGKVCEWASPPAVIENGQVMHHHAGCIWNCRCWCEQLLTD